MTLIRTMTGSESFSTGSANLLVNLIGTRDFPVEKPIFISEAAKAGLHIRAQNRATYLAASINGMREQGGYFDANYEVPDGCILRIFSKVRLRVGGRNGLPLERQGVVYIRPRADAAMNRLTLQRVEANNSTNAPVLIEGRFDILSLREVTAAGGTFNSADLAMSRPDAVAHVLRKEEISPARSAPVRLKTETVRNHEGETVKVASTRPRRAIVLE